MRGIGVNLTVKGRLETARQVQQEWLAAQRTGLSTRGFTHQPGLKNLSFLLVQVGGLSFV